jgi:hypothetical protein
LTSHLPKIRPRDYWVPLVYLILPSMPLEIFAHRLGLVPPGYINLEYLIIGALCFFLPRSVVFVLFFLESLADFAASYCSTYQFYPGSLLSSLHYLPALQTVQIVEIFAVLILVIVICAVLALFRPRPPLRLWTAGILLFFVVLLSAVAVLAGQRPLGRRDVVFSYHRLVRSPLFSLTKLQIYFHGVERASEHANTAMMVSASAQAIDYLNSPGAAKSPDVVLVLVESWGQPTNVDLAHALTAAYDNVGLAQKYQVTYGEAPFDGGTVPAEGRELCHSRFGFGILRVSPEQAKECLPALFHERGYQDISIHGYLGRMFQRATWYPNIGFDQSWFGPDLDKLKLPYCEGAFPGTCDASIAGWIGNSLLNTVGEKPRFVYWVTLNSHLPVPAKLKMPDDGVCANYPELKSSVAVCNWFRLVRTVHESVAKLAMSQLARPTVFVLVGDHAPPYDDPQLRHEFSGKNVPYVMLTPIVKSR